MATMDPRAQDIITCDMCSSPVELYCNPCQVNLCGGCSPKHLQSKSSKPHQVVLYKERLLEPVHPECASHSDQKCEMFCKTCDAPICVKCVIGSHKKHEFIGIEENILASMRAIIEADTKELEDAIIPTYEEIDSEISEKALNLHKEYDEVQKSIDKNGVKWHKEIDTTIQKQKKEAQILKDKNLDTLNKHQADMKDILSLARDIWKANKDLLKSNDVVRIKNYKSRNEKVRTVPRRITWTLPSFTPLRIEGTHLYRQFGELKAAIESEIAESEIKIKQLTKLEVDTKIEVRTNGLHGINYLLVDKMWIHGREDAIDLIDIQGTVLDTVQTLSGGKPQGLTVTKDDGHLIYGDYSVGNINMVKNGQTSTIITLPRGWRPDNMCCSLSGDLLVVVYRVPGFTECKVVRYNKDYKVIEEIQYDDKGAALYTPGKKAIYIAENKNTDICVSNANTKNVITVTQSGKLRWRYTGNLASHKYDSFTPRGIATDSQCHVLACDMDNRCIHVIDKDGQFLSFVNDCGLGFPRVLSVDKDDRLFVGESGTLKCGVKIIRYLQ